MEQDDDDCPANGYSMRVEASGPKSRTLTLSYSTHQRIHLLTLHDNVRNKKLIIKFGVS